MDNTWESCKPLLASVFESFSLMLKGLEEHSEEYVDPSPKAIEVSRIILYQLAREDLLSLHVTIARDGSDPYVWISWAVLGLYIVVTDTGEILIERVNLIDKVDGKNHSSTLIPTIEETIEQIKKILNK